MSEVSDLIREGVAALKAGRRAEAQELLTRATELDEMNENAWLWLSAVVDTVENQRICLENVLTINPNNTRAQQGLQMLQQRQPEPPPPEIPPVADDPFAVTYSVPGMGAGPAPRAERPADLPPAGEAVARFEEPEPFAAGTPAETEVVADDEVVDGPFKQWDIPDTPPAGRVTQIDPYALPQTGVFDLEDDEALAGEEVWDDDAYSGPLAGEGGVAAAPPGVARLAGDAEVKSEEGLKGYLESLPPEIKPTHLPGTGPVYPRRLLAGLALVGLGIVAALAVLVVLLVG